MSHRAVCVLMTSHIHFLPILVYFSTERMFVKLTNLDSIPSNFEKSSTPKKYDKKEQIFLGFDRQRNQLVKCVLKTLKRVKNKSQIPSTKETTWCYLWKEGTYIWKIVTFKKLDKSHFRM